MDKIVEAINDLAKLIQERGHHDEDEAALLAALYSGWKAACCVPGTSPLEVIGGDMPFHDTYLLLERQARFARKYLSSFA